jgi:hypothetical protein
MGFKGYVPCSSLGTWLEVACDWRPRARAPNDDAKVKTNKTQGKGGGRACENRYTFEAYITQMAHHVLSQTSLLYFA